MASEEKDLLEVILSYTDALYLSDLHIPEYRVQVRKGIQRLSVGDYPAEQWRIAASYILGHEMLEKDPRILYDLLLEQLD